MTGVTTRLIILSCSHTKQDTPLNFQKPLCIVATFIRRKKITCAQSKMTNFLHVTPDGYTDKGVIRKRNSLLQ